MAHCSVNARNNTHHILASFLNLLVMLFKVLQLLFDIALLDCGIIFLDFQLFQVNLIHRFNNCFVIFICGFNH
jgi:hypothetical protein